MHIRSNAAVPEDVAVIVMVLVTAVVMALVRGIVIAHAKALAGVLAKQVVQVAED